MFCGNALVEQSFTTMVLLRRVKKYLSLVAFTHTVFALPFAVIGFLLAWQQTNVEFPIALFAKMLLCMVTARTAAMAFNRYLDADIDAKNPRTAQREIPAGKISKSSALLLVIACCVVFMATCYFINGLVFALSPVALAVVLGYSYTKRFTPLAHFVLGAGLALAPIGAYLVLKPSFDLLPVLYSFVVLCWVGGFDIIYALQDEEFDKQENLRSIPTALGKKNALHLSEAVHVLCALLVIAAGWWGNFGWWYWIGCAFFLSMLLYQHLLVKPNDLSRVNRAFMTANGYASVVFAVFVTVDLLTRLEVITSCIGL